MGHYFTAIEWRHFRKPQAFLTSQKISEQRYQMAAQRDMHFCIYTVHR
jgi:hypothetical protein